MTPSRDERVEVIPRCVEVAVSEKFNTRHPYTGTAVSELQCCLQTYEAFRMLRFEVFMRVTVVF
jgi:hypothetical protein